jgi:hypothetical protein
LSLCLTSPCPFSVYTFCNENEALSAISNEPGSFHVAIVEVISFSSNPTFQYLVNVVKPAATMMNIVQESKQEKHTNLTWFDNVLTLIGTKSFISLYVKLGLHNVY